MKKHDEIICQMNCEVRLQEYIAIFKKVKTQIYKERGRVNGNSGMGQGLQKVTS